MLVIETVEQIGNFFNDLFVMSVIELLIIKFIFQIFGM